MQLMDFTAMNLLSAHKAQELCEAINSAPAEGEKMIGIWCAETGFAVRVFLLAGLPIQWFFRGPMTQEQAREELMGPQLEPAKGLH